MITLHFFEETEEGYFPEAPFETWYEVTAVPHDSDMVTVGNAFYSVKAVWWESPTVVSILLTPATETEAEG